MAETLEATRLARLVCQLYRGAFSGEVVFAIQTSDGGRYEGVAPKHYAQATQELSREEPTEGTLQVRVVRNGGGDAWVATPDGEALKVPASAIL